MEIEDTIPVVKPGDGIVTGRDIPAYQNTWKLTAINQDDSVTFRGVWNDEVSFYERNGKVILRREQHVHYNNQKEAIQIDEAERKTLKPIHLNIQNAGEEAHTDIFYEGNLIKGKKIFNIEGLDCIQKVSLPFTYELPEPVFDWHLWGILISGFPLKEDYMARFLAHESYSYQPGDFRWFTLKVTGREQIDGGKWGKVDSWIVEVKAEVLWKLWIAVQKDAAPVQKICIDGPEGMQYWWKPNVGK